MVAIGEDVTLMDWETRACELTSRSGLWGADAAQFYSVAMLQVLQDSHETYVREQPKELESIEQAFRFT